MRHHKIDATNKRIGRVASEAAYFLMGKDSPGYRRNIAPEVVLEIENSSFMRIDDRKMKSKIYSRHSGYPGGLKQENMGQVVEKEGNYEILRRAVYGMLPKNKLRQKMMKKLIIK